jgi:hypothetical protein
VNARQVVATIGATAILALTFAAVWTDQLTAVAGKFLLSAVVAAVYFFAVAAIVSWLE